MEVINPFIQENRQKIIQFLDELSVRGIQLSFIFLLCTLNHNCNYSS